MDSIRIGMFTSSQIYRLMGNGKVAGELSVPALTYIKEKSRERRLKTSISLEITSRETSWGSGLEGYVFDNHIEIGYALESKKTDIHESGLWCGTKDLISSDCVGDIKCPFSRTSFCDLVEIIEAQDIAKLKKDYPEYYWQLVSNASILKVDNAELIVFMPFESELSAIVEYIELIDDFQLQQDIQWVIHADVSRIPHLPNDSGYKNIYRFRFEVPQSEKDLLFEKAQKATELIK